MKKKDRIERDLASLEVNLSAEESNITKLKRQSTNQIKVMPAPIAPSIALNKTFTEPIKIRFLGMRFIAIWIVPFALTGIIMEVLFVAPLKGTLPFN